MKIVIFEGIDGSGKTTIINELRKNSELNHPLFIDRFIHSNYVYESLKGNLNIDVLEDICRSIKKLNTFVIYLNISPETAYSRIRIKGMHEKYSVDLLRSHKILFEESFKRLNLNVITIDAEEPLEEIIEKLGSIVYES